MFQQRRYNNGLTEGAKYTSGQVPRGARPDAEVLDKMYLIKNVSTLRATYQIRLLAFRAVEKRTTLIIRVPESCQFEASLKSLLKTCGKSVLREKL
jgi:hypothetical protein